MTVKNSNTQLLSNSDRINEASILLYRAIAINDLMFEANSHHTPCLADGTISGVSDALHIMLTQAKDLIDGVNPYKEINHA